MVISSKDVTKSRKAALAVIKDLLSLEDVEGHFSGMNGDYYSSEKFIVTWLGNKNGVACEFKLEKSSTIYHAVTGKCCVYGYANLLTERQIDSYQLFEQGLLSVGLKLCQRGAEREQFIADFVVPFNKKINQMLKKAD